MAGFVARFDQIDERLVESVALVKVAGQHTVMLGQVAGMLFLNVLAHAHVELARWAEAMVVAPATANTIAKLALGIASNLLSTTALATSAPLVLAPAMNSSMWGHPAVQANVATLHDRGAIIVGPGEGELACGEEGPGRMAEPDEILEAVRGVLAR